MNKSVLILIDMQKSMAEPLAGARNNPDAERQIGRLLAAWRKLEAPVVHVRHMSRSESSPFWPGRSGVEFQEAFFPEAGEQVFEKNVPDAFAHSGLERWLRLRELVDLVIVGVSTNNSVESTVRTAGNLGFRVRVPCDATFTFDKTDYNGILRSAEEVHAMSLANLQGEYAEIVTTESLLAEH
ncbi:cysteine hydrolase family protein [Gilvimarinus sp. F26214L]|uniref:cysteine hydrolase family protein n=1 Tax=Gilvimarinus sp. DZF01 TaxID=3461371 RepID=UPI004046137F